MAVTRLVRLGFATIAALMLAAIAPGAGTGQVAYGDPVERSGVVIVGDSLTGGNASTIRGELAAAGLGDVRVEGLSARRIAVSFSFMGLRDSGVQRVRTLRAAGVEPELWVIQLGTNDLGVVENCKCDDPVAFAGDIIDELLAEIGPGVPTAWVTVSNRYRPEPTNHFNEAVGRRASADPFLTLIDWHAIARERPDWFLDDVHPNARGVGAFADLYIDRITALLADPLGVPWDGSGVGQARRLGPIG